jgi:hypothetical protein
MFLSSFLLLHASYCKSLITNDLEVRGFEPMDRLGHSTDFHYLPRAA